LKGLQKCRPFFLPAMPCLPAHARRPCVSARRGDGAPPHLLEVEADIEIEA